MTRDAAAHAPLCVIVFSFMFSTESRDCGFGRKAYEMPCRAGSGCMRMRHHVALPRMLPGHLGYPAVIEVRCERRSNIFIECVRGGLLQHEAPQRIPVAWVAHKHAWHYSVYPSGHSSSIQTKVTFRKNCIWLPGTDQRGYGYES